MATCPRSAAAACALVADAAAGRRQRARAADPGCGQRWKVPARRMRRRNSKVMHKASGRTPRYGALAADAAHDHARQGAGDQDARPVHADRQADAAARCPAQDQRHRAVSPSIRAFPAWSMPRSPPVRCSAASSRVSTTPVKGRRGVIQVVQAANASRSWPTVTGAPRRPSRSSDPNGTPARRRHRQRAIPQGIATRSTAACRRRATTAMPTPPCQPRPSGRGGL